MKRSIKAAVRLTALLGMAAALGTAASASEPRMVAGVTCDNPPRINCPEANCLAELSGFQGAALEPKSGRKFFLDFPCDLKPNEKVLFILNIHGAGSVGNWQRHYFPAIDGKEKYRLVVATPTAAAPMPGRTWQAAADDQYLQDISDLVIRSFGKSNIKAFWLAGHSQGGITSRRIVCSPYFRDKVDGYISLSGGRVGNPTGYVRIGAAQGAPGGGAPARGATSPAAPAGRAGGVAPAAAAQPPLDCDFSYIYSQGELEGSIPATSTWADKYGCGARVRQPDIVDTQAGYVTATDQTRGPGWGRHARPGTANVFTFPGCKGGRIVADVNRLDKGHTEGYEPKILDRILGLMASAPGGKLRRG